MLDALCGKRALTKELEVLRARVSDMEKKLDENADIIVRLNREMIMATARIADLERARAPPAREPETEGHWRFFSAMDEQQ